MSKASQRQLAVLAQLVHGTRRLHQVARDLGWRPESCATTAASCIRQGWLTKDPETTSYTLTLTGRAVLTCGHDLTKGT